VIIDGGWIIRDKEFDQIMNMISFNWSSESISSTIDFFKQAYREFGFTSDDLL
jgi:hypothetical protein